jgi:peptidoglycan/LPS O-acetylase OafA/YrhL
MEQPADNFLLLRFLAALIVVFCHAYDTVGLSEADPIARLHLGAGAAPPITGGSIAVDMFFAISGFMIAGSWLRRRALFDFLLARVLRIVPAYAACVVLCAFALGAVVTTLPLRDYLLDPATRGYVFGNLDFTHLAWRLPGVFDDNPHPRGVNDSLWSLPGEVRMYAYVAVFGAIGVLSRRRVANLALLGLFVLGCFVPARIPLIYDPALYLRVAAMFALGVAFCVNRASIPVSGWIVLALAAASALAHGTPAFAPIFGLATGYFCLWFAYGTRWFGFNRCGDYSYGMYLWNWPLQQLIAHYVAVERPLLMFAASFPAILLVAILSWHWLEKPALALKRFAPQRWRVVRTAAPIEAPLAVGAAAK